MFDSISSLIKRCDLFGYTNFVYFNQNSKYKTVYFGMFSLIFVAYLMFRFVSGLENIFSSDKETSNINYFKLIDENMENINSTKFPILINFKSYNIRNKKQIKLSSIFSNEINVKYQNIKTSVFKQKRFNFTDIFRRVDELKEDELNGFEIFNYFDYKTKINKDNLYLIDLSKIDFLNNLNNSISILFHHNNINKRNENFDVNDVYFSINIINLKIYINNLKLKNDFSRKAIENNYFNTNNKKAININVSKKLLYTFQNKFFQSKQYELQEILDYSIKETMNNEDFFQLNINMNDEIEIFERYFSNINTILSEFGGLLSSFKALGILIRFLYEYIYLRNISEFIFDQGKGNQTNFKLNKSNNNDKSNEDSNKKQTKNFFWKSDLLRQHYEGEFCNNKFDVKINDKTKPSDSLNQSVIITNEELICKTNKEIHLNKDLIDKEASQEESFLKQKLIKVHKSYAGETGKSINFNDKLEEVYPNFKPKTEKNLKKKFLDSIFFCFKEKPKNEVMTIKNIIKDLLDIRRLFLVSIQNNSFYEFYSEEILKKKELKLNLDKIII